MTAARAEAIDFTKAYLFDGITFVTDANAQFSNLVAVVIRPFGRDIWISICITLLITCFILKLASQTKLFYLGEKWLYPIKAVLNQSKF